MEVDESRGMHICEDAVKRLKSVCILYILQLVIMQLYLKIKMMVTLGPIHTRCELAGFVKCPEKVNMAFPMHFNEHTLHQCIPF